MKLNHNYSSRFRILKGGKISLVVSALLGSATLSFAAPSGGVVTSGSATISQSGNTTNINQSTSKASINWQKFGIKADEVVNFNQPNKNSITLNRVIGNERSIIDGALNANGQVWILNSNGVLFSKNASINTSGLLATTKDISDTNFQKGNYTFSGDSTESIINQGTIKVKNNGYVIFASNEAKNDGVIEAIKGRVQLTGADEYTINLNGNSLIDLSVDKGTLDALVENSGTILADGGEIYLTTHAVDELLRGVVNNTGIIEANSLDGISGHVELYAHGGTANIDGTIKAKGGFVETSGKELNVASTTSIETSKWLLDPVNMTIESTGGSDITGASVSATAIQSALVSADVELQADQDITIAENITWGDDTKLTLTAGDEIYVNATIENTNATNGGVYFNAANKNSTIKFDATTGKVIINNINQLQWISQALNGNYELGSNIDASDTRNWNSGYGFKQIGDQSTNNIDTRFTGNFDGKGYIIDGLYINRPSENNVGLFGYTTNGAKISNLGLTNLYIRGNEEVGGLIGRSYSNTLVSNSYVTGKVIGRGNVGGLIGLTYYTTINNSYTNTTLSASYNIGGLVGYVEQNLNINNSYAIGKISGSFNVGGLVGFIQVRSPITNSYWDIDTTGVTSGVGEGPYSGSFVGIYSSTNTVNAFNQATYAGFDFTNDWFMIEGETRPFLRSEYSTTITNDHQLQLMAMNLSADYTLANDIKYTGDMWSSKGFDPIGTNATRFTGSFDGLGHTISDVLINRPTTDDVGLFGHTNAGSLIQNVGLVGGSVKGKNSVGGLVGKHRGTITNSYATGSVDGQNDVGGLVGENIETIQNSYAAGSVSGISSVGGLVGFDMYGTIENSYASGSVSGTNNVGGLIGAAMSSPTTDSYWDIGTTGQTSSSGGGTGLTTEEMQEQANFIGFDFTNDWIIYEGHTRPLLRAFMTEVTVNAGATRDYNGEVYTPSFDKLNYSKEVDTSLVLGTPNFTTTGNLKNAGTATINVDGLYSSQQGYIINYDTGTLTTNKKDITVTANSKTTTYDGTIQTSSGFTASGLVSGETVAVLDGVTGDSVSGKNAGTYNTNLSGTDENYNLTFQNGSLVINKRALSLEASKEYDGTADLTGFVSFGNLVGNETLEYADATANSKKSGNDNFISNITLKDGENGGLASNYELPSLLANSSNNSVTIGAKPDLTTVITPIANKTVLTNKDIDTLVKNDIDIKTILQQVNNNEFSLIPGIVMKVLNGGINLPFGSKQEFNLDNNKKEEEKNNTI